MFGKNQYHDVLMSLESRATKLEKESIEMHKWLSELWRTAVNQTKIIEMILDHLSLEIKTIPHQPERIELVKKSEPVEKSK